MSQLSAKKNRPKPSLGRFPAEVSVVIRGERGNYNHLAQQVNVEISVVIRGEIGDDSGPNQRVGRLPKLKSRGRRRR